MLTPHAVRLACRPHSFNCHEGSKHAWGDDKKLPLESGGLRFRPVGVGRVPFFRGI